jgi:hypothetical protein
MWPSLCFAGQFLVDVSWRGKYIRESFIGSGRWRGSFPQGGREQVVSKRNSIVCALAAILVVLFSRLVSADAVTFYDPRAGTDMLLSAQDMGPLDSIYASAQFGIDALPQDAKCLSWLGGGGASMGVPTSNWHYGCSATSAGMMFAYYDRNGYDNLFVGAIPDFMDANHSIIATQDHIDDYWIDSGQGGPDPWEAGGTEHDWATCTADFMGTNQWKWDYLNNDGIIDFNADGSTALFRRTDEQKVYDYIPSAHYGTPQTALSHGLRLFAESRGYGVLENFTQNVDCIVANGFSFADYMGEIDGGNPVMLQIAGHSMVGVGYDETGNTVYLHDTWGNYIGSMTWESGAAYAGREFRAVTVIHLEPLAVPEPATIVLMLIGLFAVVLKRRRWKAA